jgi:hypothetical protein
VTLENGNVIEPSQVMESAPPSQGMIFIFLPSIEYLEGFLDKEAEFD